MSALVAVTREDLQAPGYKLVRSIRDDGGPFDSICPSKAFLTGATYFPFTVRSSSLRLGWRSPGAAREAERASAPARSQRVPGGADAEAPQLTTSSGRGCGGGCGGGGGSRQPSALRAGELAARGRRQLTGRTAGRSSRRSWNRSRQD